MMTGVSTSQVRSMWALNSWFRWCCVVRKKHTKYLGCVTSLKCHCFILYYSIQVQELLIQADGESASTAATGPGQVKAALVLSLTLLP